jgi:hypothetical protein
MVYSVWKTRCSDENVEALVEPFDCRGSLTGNLFDNVRLIKNDEVEANTQAVYQSLPNSWNMDRTLCLEESSKRLLQAKRG